MISFYSDRYQRLELFPEAERHGFSSITLSDGMHTVRRRARLLERIVFPLRKYTMYTLSFDGASPALAYLTDCDGLFDTGVRFIQPDGSLVKTEAAGMTYHFAPCCGRLDAPCGLCFFQGFFHIFYLCAPFAAMPDVLYWGHAVSRDFLRWNHLPFFLEPPPEMRQARYAADGTASGCVTTENGKMCVYASRSVLRRESGTVLREYTLSAESRDALRFSEESPVPGLVPPAGFGPVFRSPKIAETAAGTYMVLGSTAREHGAVLLYRPTETGWQYVRPLHREKDAAFLDNPDFFAVGRTHALLASLPPAGDTCPARWYTGSFRDGRFKVRQRGAMDFGNALCAPQTFLHGDRRIIFARILGGNGCMTIPREVFTRAGRLLTRPAAEVYSLVGESMYDNACKTVSLPLPCRALLVRLQFSFPADFLLRLEGTAGNGLTLRQTADSLHLSAGAFSRKVNSAPVQFLEIFTDDTAIEIFINDNSLAGTVHLPSADAPWTLTLETARQNGRLQVFPMADCTAANPPVDKDAPAETFDFVDYFENF